MLPNYVVRHWRGQLSLPVSYWINGGLLLAAIYLALTGVHAGIEKSESSLRFIALASLAAFPVLVAVWAWVVVGIWRSADRDASAWSGAAKFTIVCGLIYMASDLATSIFPQVKDYSLIVLGRDPVGEAEIKVSADGKSVTVSGAFGAGSAAEVTKILDATPAAKVLVLDSNGGRLREANQLAQTIRSRDLDTRVEKQCSSACTNVFLAGRNRLAAPGARIGFHRPAYAGIDADEQRKITQTMLDTYRAAGLTESFVHRVGQTPPDQMWHPTRDELIAANVLTKASRGK